MAPPLGSQATEVEFVVLPSASPVGAVAQASIIQLQSTQDNITAHAGGGQANGVPITANIVNITTVATIGDSLTLPKSLAGVDIVVHNSGALSANVFPASGEFINALAVNTALAIPAGTSTTFTCLTTGKWITVPRVPS